MIQSMKQKYEEISVTLQSILCVIGNIEQPAKNKIAKHLIMEGEYKPDPNRNQIPIGTRCVNESK